MVRAAWDFPGIVVFWLTMRIDRIGGTGALQGWYSESCTEKNQLFARYWLRMNEDPNASFHQDWISWSCSTVRLIDCIP